VSAAPTPRDAEQKRAARARPVALALGVGGLIAWVIGSVFEPRQAYFSWLAAYGYGVSLSLGAMLTVMVSHATGAKWFLVLRRLAETVAATMPLFVLLFVPLLFGLSELYPWVRMGALEPAARAALGHKSVYLNVPFFVVRAALYLGSWSACGVLLWRWSVLQDAHPRDPGLTWKLRVLSAVALPALGFTITFAAFDWFMSLTPEWVSTIFGVYYFAGSFLAALALVGTLAFGLQQRGYLTDEVAVSHYHALGKLMLTFVIFWAYMAYAQYFIIWIADVPDEVAWYVPRSRGSWGWVSVLIVVGHFALPFLALLSWQFKRRAASLVAVCVWLLAMHYIDVYWLVLPALHVNRLAPSWLDLAALLAVAGCGTAYGCWLAQGRAALPVGDPEIETSLEYMTR
jgi:hypothetical protein